MILIIIGLPGSGKTTYYNNNFSKNYKLYDDFISNFMDGDIINDIKNNVDICLIDPRLCNYNLFKSIINIIIEYIKPNNINLILFENMPNLCLINSQKRNKNVINSINKYTNIYNINNYIHDINNYNCEIIQVYS